MANLQVKNIPDGLHGRLCAQASKQDASVNDLVLEAIERHLSRMEFHERIAAQKPQKFKINPSDYIAMERVQRDAPIEF